jgi:hypothetical protein
MIEVYNCNYGTQLVAIQASQWPVTQPVIEGGWSPTANNRKLYCPNLSGSAFSQKNQTFISG